MSNRRFDSILAAFPGKRVLVVGDVMLDEYVWGDARRISPEAPVLVVETRQRTYAPGGAANAAVNAVALRGDAHLCGVVGDDHYAEELRAALARCGVHSDGLLTVSGRSTTTKTRIIAHKQQVVRLDTEERESLPRQVENYLVARFEEQLAAADVCILSDYAKGVVSRRVAQSLIAAASAAGKPVLVDPKGDDRSKYTGATLVKPNLHEAQLLLKREITGMDAVVTAGQDLLDLLGVTAVLLTLGSQGMALFQRGARPVHIRSAAREIFDVTGAGDTVIGTLALALAAGGTLEYAGRLGNCAAGIVVGKVGTSTVTLTELASKIQKPRRTLPRKPAKPAVSRP
jgi:D-beta-D-heptose 7-phosphate kinase/D-beta-D-heptose 1-phosphate adenosyltransferase